MKRRKEYLLKRVYNNKNL